MSWKSPSVQNHFDEIAPQYDEFKRRNWYYYAALKKLLREVVPRGKRVLEIGCGTGEILAAVDPAWGVGLDLSDRMVEIARAKFANRPHWSFFAGTVESFSETHTEFDYILLVDVVEHLESLSSTLKHIHRLSQTSTKVVVSMANPIWEPILMMAEKLRMKMPEGPHRRIGARRLIAEFQNCGFSMCAWKKYLHIPVHFPLVSETLNKLFARTPLVRNLGLIEVMVFQKM